MKTAKYISLFLLSLVVFACKENSKQNIEKDNLNKAIDTTINKEIVNTSDVDSIEITEAEQEEKEQTSNAETARYINERYNFALNYPNFLIPEDESDNGDGRMFVSEDEKFLMLAYGSLNLSDNLQQDYEIATENDCYFEEDYNITFKTYGETWFVINGVHEKTMFYIYSVLSDDVVVSVYFEYPLNEKDKYREYVGQIIETLNTNYGKPIP
ncbi:MAG: hypothetical protein GX879_07220 [Bacteroidales bacterium]|nr:hypothetical protein [Bacteroidales bacterium]